MSYIKQFANLHTHSTHSDGVYTPEQIVAIAKKEGYGAFAVTDHDTVTACEPVRIECEKNGMEWIFGAEFTSPCSSLGAAFHIVGYNFDPEYPKMKQYLEELSYCQTFETKFLFDMAVTEGSIKNISWNDVLEYNDGITWLCNEQVFRAMKSKGLITDTEYPEWNARLFRDRRRIVPKKPYEFMQAEETIKLIRDAGGIAIIAHPAGQLHHIEALIKMGISGLEVWHDDLRKRNEELHALNVAKKYDLFVSGGCDHSGLCGGQYERFEDPQKCPFYVEEQTLGTSEFFFRELKSSKKASGRNEILDHYIKLQENV